MEQGSVSKNASDLIKECFHPMLSDREGTSMTKDHELTRYAIREGLTSLD
jgi:hypothetical protein